jgi:hypothetical protein
MQRADYGDEPGKRGLLREAFQGHFPNESDSLDEWDVACTRAANKNAALKERVAAEFSARHIEEPLYATDRLQGLVFVVVEQRLLTGTTADMQFGWTRFGNMGVNLGPHQEVISGKLADEGKMDLKELTKTVEEAFSKVENSPEAQAIRGRDAERLSIQPDVLATLDFLTKRNHFTGTCPLCD